MFTCDNDKDSARSKSPTHSIARFPLAPTSHSAPPSQATSHQKSANAHRKSRYYFALVNFPTPNAQSTTTHRFVSRRPANNKSNPPAFSPNPQSCLTNPSGTRAPRPTARAPVAGKKICPPTHPEALTRRRWNAKRRMNKKEEGDHGRQDEAQKMAT